MAPDLLKQGGEEEKQKDRIETGESKLGNTEIWKILISAVILYILYRAVKLSFEEPSRTSTSKEHLEQIYQIMEIPEIESADSSEIELVDEKLEPLGDDLYVKKSDKNITLYYR